jgi:hypothetical protein
MNQGARDLDRESLTMTALKNLARAVAGYSGRKNLVWMSAGFPAPLVFAKPAQFEGTGDSGADPLRQNWAAARSRDDANNTSYLLSAARISIYPVDVRGVDVRGIGLSTSSMAVTGGDFVGSGDQYSRTLKAQNDTVFAQRVLDREIAEGTGGRAFYGNNDLAGVINHVIEDGESYYTVSYEPESDNGKNQFRSIDIRSSQPGLQLSYRRGYWTRPKPVQSVDALAAAMKRGNPPATMLGVTAQVLPLNGQKNTVRVTYRIDAQGIEFADAPGNKRHAMVDCFIAAYDSKGKDVGHQIDTLDATVPQQKIAQLMQSGLPATQEIQLAKGSYTLRVGVMDRATQRVGSIEVPVTISE